MEIKSVSNKMFTLRLYILRIQSHVPKTEWNLKHNSSTLWNNLIEQCIMTNWVYGGMQDSISGSKSSKLTFLSLQDILNAVFINYLWNQTQFDILVSPVTFSFIWGHEEFTIIWKTNILSKDIEILFQTHSLTSVCIYLHL